jgi:uncharacterized membrane protein YhaH (DUF805 family)
MKWAILPLRKYADFTGRARRREYWSFVLLTAIVFAILYFVERRLDPATRGMALPTLLFQLAILLPILAVGARRLHDTDRSGWWLLVFYGPGLVSALLPWLGIAGRAPTLAVAVVSLIGLAILIVFFLLEGTRGPNRFGPDPKGSPAVPSDAA